MRIASSDLLLTSVERALLPTLMIQRDAQGAIEPSSIACHYCESDSIQVVAAKKPWVGFEKISGNYKQYYCNACGLFFIEPTPSQGDILNFFQEDYNRSRYSANTDLEKLLAWPKQDKTPYGILKIAIKRLLRHGPPEAVILSHYFRRSALNRIRLIDIGCAQGQLVRALRHLSIEAYGLEPHRETVEILRRDGCDYIWQGELFSFPFETQYDVVCLISTLTHIRDIHRAFGILHRLLKDNGLVVTKEVNTDLASLDMSAPHAFTYFSTKFMRRVQQDFHFDGLDVWNYRAASRSLELSESKIDSDCESRYFVFKKGRVGCADR